MLVVIAEVELKNGVESEFKNRLAEQHKILSKLDGFVSRRLLKSSDGKYRIMVEHQSKETFEKMTQSPEHKKFHDESVTFMESHPIPKIFEVVYG